MTTASSAVFDTPDGITLLAVVGRTVLLYLLIVIALRLLGTRELGQNSVYDLVLIVVIGNAIQNALVAGSNTLSAGLLSAVTLLVGLPLGGVQAFVARHVARDTPRIGVEASGDFLRGFVSACFLAGSGLAIALLGYLYPVKRYLDRAAFAGSIQGESRRPILSMMLLGAGLAGVALLGTWGSIQWAPRWAAQLAPDPARHAREWTQIMSATGAIWNSVR